MKKNLFFAALAITGLASCGSDLLVEENPTELTKSDEITFENTLANNATRTSKTVFANGDQMGIFGFQDGTTKIFNNQTVGFDGTKWTYSPLKYWNSGSTYEFYGIYPYQAIDPKTYTFDEATRLYTITDFLVKDAIADQVDIMIAEKNTTTPYNTVNMNFNHLLSSVHFFAKLSSNVSDSGLGTVTINSLKVSGLKSIGTFTQSGFNATSNDVEGVWSDINGGYTFPTIAATGVAKTLTAGAMGTTGNIVRDLLMVPQPINATLEVEYTINYTDGSASTYKKTLPLESIKAAGVPVTKWDMNTIYNYTMTLDPTKTFAPDFNKDCIDWDGSTNGDCEKTPNSSLVGPDADGNYQVGVDTDGDGTPDVFYPVVWEDVDGDGKLEAGVDRDGDGHIDNVDGDNANNADSSDPGYGDVSDGNANNPGGKDIILVDTNNDGKPDTQLEREPTTTVEPENPTDQPDDPSTPSGKKYTVDWNGSLDADGNASSAAADETTPVNYSRLVLGDDGEYYIEVDVDQDGTYNGATDTRTLVQWADLDGDGKLEGYIANVDGDNVNNGSPLATDGNKNADGTIDLNPNGYDVIIIDTDGDGVCDTQLEKAYTGPVTPSDEKDAVITFDATIENWSNAVTPEVEITK